MAPGDYFEEYAGHVLKEMVEFSQFTWLPMVPFVALVEQVLFWYLPQNASTSARTPPPPQRPRPAAAASMRRI